MRTRTTWTVALVVAGTMVLLDPTGDSQSSPVTDLPPPPAETELVVVEELAGWVGGLPSSESPVGAESDIASTIRDRERSFRVFREFNHPDSHEAVLRSVPFADEIAWAAAETQLDSLLIASVVTAESGFDPSVVSIRGALGLMQLMPETAAQYGAGQDPLDPRSNLLAGSLYLRRLIDRYHGDLEVALAAYNAGPGNVRRYGGVPPFTETNRYVDRVLTTYVELHRRVWAASDLGEMLERHEPVAELRTQVVANEPS